MFLSLRFHLPGKVHTYSILFSNRVNGQPLSEVGRNPLVTCLDLRVFWSAAASFLPVFPVVFFQFRGFRVDEVGNRPTRIPPLLGRMAALVGQ